MGACFSYRRIAVPPGSTLEKEFQVIQEQLRWELGHSGYTGTLAECAGIEDTGREFSDQIEALDWLDCNTNKWGPAKAVKVKGQPGYLVGGLCSE